MKLDISGIKLYNSKEIKKDILGRELKAGDIVAAYKKGGIVLGVFNGISAISSASTVRTSHKTNCNNISKNNNYYSNSDYNFLHLLIW